jgi:hypothetical protein
MVGQMIDMEALDLEIERKVRRYQKKFNISDADIAWIFLRLGTSYYFKDISSRGLNGNQPINHNGHVASLLHH